MTDRTPRLWLGAMGIASTLGSEPMVGWQWYQRLKARGPVTVFAASIFDHPDFLPPEAREDMVFIDTGARGREHFTRHVIRNQLAWWRGVRAHLKAQAGPDDVLCIAVPAAIWTLPWVAGLPIARDRIFFGPLGVDWIPRSIRGSLWPGVRNLRTAVFFALWRLLAPALPRHLSLRAPFPGFGRLVGPRFDLLATVPDFMPPLDAVRTRPRTGSDVLLLYDARPRKRFGPSFAFASELARSRGVALHIVGAPDEVAAGLARDYGATTRLVFSPRLERADFLRLLETQIATVVLLSSSEAASVLLVEALLLGCEVFAHRIGGIQWLIAAAGSTSSQTWRGAEVVGFRWDAAAAARFAEGANAGFVRIVAAIESALGDVAA